MTRPIAGLGWLAIAAVVATGAFACKKKAAAPPAETSTTTPAPQPPAQPVFMVVGVDVGRTVDAEKRIATPASTFGRRDTIYASVGTVGTASDAKLAAKWTFQTGQVVDSSERTISPTGPAHTEFHIAKRSGWPAGKYRVEIFLNGASTGVKEFEVTR